MKIIKSTTGFAVVRIPDHLSFEALNLVVDLETGNMEFDWAPLREILAVNAELALSSDKEILELIGAWYCYLRLAGYRHEVAEQYLLSCEAASVFGISRIISGPDTLH